MASTVVFGTTPTDELPRLIITTGHSIPFQPGDPAFAFPKLDEYTDLLKRLNEEDDRSIDNLLSSFTDMCGTPLFYR